MTRNIGLHKKGSEHATHGNLRQDGGVFCWQPTFQSLPGSGASVLRTQHSSPAPHCGTARAAEHKIKYI
jgi:hypothetical protein